MNENINDKVIAVWIEDGYHCSDLRFPPINQSAETVQEIERQHIRKWIEEAREREIKTRIEPFDQSWVKN